jgi:ferredoxin
MRPDQYHRDIACSAGANARQCHKFLEIRKGRVIMPTLTVEGMGQFEVPQGKRLVVALSQDAGVDQLHACGGNARCTTCRVEFVKGEPDRMTVAERDLLKARGLSGIRLSCQITCDEDMTVRVISRLAGSGRKDAGHLPSAEIQPPPGWTTKET